MQVSSEAGWQELLSSAQNVFELSNRLPMAVHRLKSGPSPVFYGEYMLGSDGWSIASSLATLHGDSVVHFLTLEPEPAYFLDSTGGYGAFTVRLGEGLKGYVRDLFDPSLKHGPGTIAYVADVVAIFGPSGRWGIWVERDIAGIVARTTRMAWPPGRPRMAHSSSRATR